jgi:hypothetical protein
MAMFMAGSGWLAPGCAAAHAGFWLFHKGSWVSDKFILRQNGFSYWIFYEKHGKLARWPEKCTYFPVRRLSGLL